VSAAWRERAACNDAKPDVFFPRWGDRTSERAAKRICNGMPQMLDGQILGPSRTSPCPVRDECLAFALDAEAGKHGHDRHGIFGGKTASQRADLDTTRRSARPPVDSCTRPGRDLGVRRHHAFGQELCAPCRRHEQTSAERRDREVRVLRLAPHHTAYEIALLTGECRGTVRGILARHDDESRTA
jgi:hypothetical protein